MTTPKQAAQTQLETALKTYRLDRYITVKTIHHWIQNLSEDLNDFSYVTMAVGLLDEEIENFQAVQEVVKAIVAYYPHVPPKRLGNKTPTQKAEDHPDKRGNLHQTKTALGSLEYVSFYEQGMNWLHTNKAQEAIQSFNQAFQILKRDQTTYSELYRILANKAIAHFMAGDEKTGVALLKEAIRLNPNYEFAHQTLQRYHDGFYDNGIYQGRMQIMEQRAKWEQVHDPDKVMQWPIQKILDTFARYKVLLTKDEFVRAAQNAYEIDQVTDKLIDPYFHSTWEFEEDFAWMGAEALWQAWCPQLPCVELLLHHIDQIEDEFSDRLPTKAVIQEHLPAIRQILEKASDRLIKRWQEFADYPSDQDTLLNTLITFGPEIGLPYAKALAQLLNKKTQDPLFLLIPLKLSTVNPAGAEKEINALLKKHPLDCDLRQEIAVWYWDYDIIDKAETYFIDALAVAQDREKKKQFFLPYHRQSLYLDYHYLYEKLINFYESLGNSDRVKYFQQQLKELEPHQGRLSGRDAETDHKKSMRWMKDYDQERINKDPAMRYLAFLKPFKINFKTSNKVETQMTFFSTSGKKVKVGRNDPCPCGSGKKYKKCCLT